MAKRKIDRMHELFGITDGHKCSECDHFCTYTANRTYFKCEVYGNSSSESTDWRKKYDACGMFNKQYKGMPVVKTQRWKEPKVEEQIEGQMALGELFGGEFK